MKHDFPQFKIRLPSQLKADLEASAASVGRTLTAEIVARLQSSLEDGETTGGLRELSVSQSQVIRLLGYSLMHLTTQQSGDSKDLKAFKSSLRNLAISLNNQDLGGALSHASEVAFGTTPENNQSLSTDRM